MKGESPTLRNVVSEANVYLQENLNPILGIVFFYETPPIELENHLFFLISDEMMYCRNGHKTYCDNLDGILQRLYV